MGRQAYLLRLALGRSAYEPPEDGPLFASSRAGDWSSALGTSLQTEAATGPEDPPQDVQLYNARGHPFNPWARARARHSREAMNDVLSVVGVVERSLPDVLQEFGGGLDDQTGQVASEDENSFGEKIGWAADIENQFLSWWIHAFTNRLLVSTKIYPRSNTETEDSRCSLHQPRAHSSIS
jgi:hypothetical protein